MRCRITALVVALAAAACVEPYAVQAQAATRPNIVVILADDMGYSDVGAYGGEIETPHIDRLASRGVRFSQFYNVARCSPTRASLLTGLYPHQAGVGWLAGYDFGGDGAPPPGYLGHLNDRSVTIAEALGQNGYRTLMVGKWHVGRPEGGAAPWQRGFDRYFGRLVRADYWDATELSLDGERYDWEAHHEGPFYMTDAQGDFAVRFVEEHLAADPDRPFFLYLAFNAPHFPIHAPEADVASYRERYRRGWDVLRTERHERLVVQGLIDASTPAAPRDPAVPAWDAVPAAEQRDWAEKMAVYAAMIDRLDANVGKLLRALEAHDELDETLILFLSDNGASAEGIGIRRDQIGTDAGTPPGGPGTFQGVLMPWANLSNTPFRDYKHFTHEGGIATPLIAHWPAVVPDSLRGTVTDAPGLVIDVMATALDAAGVPYPETYEGREVTPLEGRSLLPVLARGQRQGHEMIFWEHEGNRAVREGRWKLVAYHEEQLEALYRWWRFSPRAGLRDVSGAWQLYDLAADRTEQHDVADQHPARVVRMSAAYRAWAARTQVESWDAMQCRHPDRRFRALCEEQADSGDE